MNRYSDFNLLHYSELFSIRVIRKLLYSLEIILIKKFHINYLYMSSLESPKQKELIKIINGDKKSVICRSLKFGLTLSEIRTPTILDVRTFNVKKMTAKQIENAKWTLVYVSAVTPETKKKMRKIIPSDFPEIKIV